MNASKPVLKETTPTTMTTVELAPPELSQGEQTLGIKANRDEHGDAPKLPVKRRPRNPLVKAILMVLRRSHLYFGLLLAPWALLYGVTAYLFNHPTHFSTNVIETIPAAMIPNDLAIRSWDATSRAEQVVGELNSRFQDEGKDLQLSSATAPKFESASVTGMMDRDGKTYSVTLPAHEGTGTFRVFPMRAEPTATKPPFFAIAPAGGAINRGRSGSRGGGEMGNAPNANSTKNEMVAPTDAASRAGSKSDIPANRSPLKLTPDPSGILQSQIAEVLRQLEPQLDFDDEQVRITAVPSLIFQVESQGTRWDCKHDEFSGSVSATNADSKSTAEFSWRRFFLRLHTAHGYPADGTLSARWFWAILVDVMAFVMVFWGVSGIVMWWQIKSTRRWGSAAMVASVIAAGWLGIGMYYAIRS